MEHTELNQDAMPDFDITEYPQYAHCHELCDDDDDDWDDDDDDDD